jgi:cellulose synthase (UDP-forming)
MSTDIGLPRDPSIPPSGPDDSFWSDLARATDRERQSRGRHAARFTPANSATEPLTAVSAVGYQDAHAPMAPLRQFPTVSVVIPCRDNEKTIRATVESVLRQDYRALRQIILVGSPIDTTWKGLECIYDRRLLIQEVAAPSGTLDLDFKRDFGIRQSSSEIVSLVDSGMVLPHDWLTRAVAALCGSGAGGVAAVRPSISGDLLDRFIDRRGLGAKTSSVRAMGRQDGVRVNAFDPGEPTAIERRALADARPPDIAPRSVPTYGVDLTTAAAVSNKPSDVAAFEVHGRTPGTSHDPRHVLGVPIQPGRPVHLAQTRPGADRGHRRDARELGRVSTPPQSPAAPGRYAMPPSDAEKYQYLVGGQKRWLLVVQYVAFLAVAVSFAGFATSSYWTFIFSIPLLLFAVEQTLALYTSTRRRRIDLASHQHTVENWTPRRYPSVDVFVPTAGEELDLLDNTMRHLNLLEWPGELRVSILDDSGRTSVRHLATVYGFSYLARPGSEYKKAGNLRYGAERTNGEIIAIFDADFVPRPDFLLELVPYMDDPNVGIVQSPQFFDTAKRMNWIQRCSAATQELFYRFIQPSRDALGAAVCVGTSALYRRTALDAIGGFPKIGQSEDIYTGLWMQDAGYSTRYVPVVVSKGVTPNNLDNFVAQQYRWCEGSITMLATKRFHTTPNLALKARLSYWSGFLYYVSTALSSLIIPLPAIIMTWFFPQWVRPWNTIWLAGTLALWLVVYPMVMHGRWRIEVLRIQTVYGFAHVFNIVHLIRGRVVEWHPTGSKAPAPIAIKVKRFYTAYLGLALIIATVGLTLRAAEDGLTLFAGMLVFFAVNLYVVGPLVVSGIEDELRSRRQARFAERSRRQVRVTEPVTRRPTKVAA